MNLYELGVLEGMEKSAKEKDDYTTEAAAGLMLGGVVAGGGIAKSVKHVSDFNAAAPHIPSPAPVAAAAKSAPSTVTKAIKAVGKVL